MRNWAAKVALLALLYSNYVPLIRSPWRSHAGLIWFSSFGTGGGSWNSVCPAQSIFSVSASKGVFAVLHLFCVVPCGSRRAWLESIAASRVPDFDVGVGITRCHMAIPSRKSQLSCLACHALASSPPIGTTPNPTPKKYTQDTSLQTIVFFLLGHKHYRGSKREALWKTTQQWDAIHLYIGTGPLTPDCQVVEIAVWPQGVAWSFFVMERMLGPEWFLNLVQEGVRDAHDWFVVPLLFNVVLFMVSGGAQCNIVKMCSRPVADSSLNEMNCLELKSTLVPQPIWKGNAN